MDSKKILEKYKSSFLDIPFIKENLVFAIGEERLQEAIKQLGAKDINDLASVFGLGDFCLKTNAKKIAKLANDFDNEKKQWIRNLCDEEKEVIVKDEISNFECTYTYDIKPVLEKLNTYFDKDFILKIWNKVK